MFGLDLEKAVVPLEPMLPARKKRGRPPTDRRQIVDAILYVIKGGIQWRMLPSDFPPYQTVFHIFRQWTLNHTWEALNARLRAHVREAEGKRCRPTAAILDSQSVKSDPHGGNVGYDAAKRIKGRKRHILVDTLGLLLSVWVTRANVTERVRAQDLLARTLNWFTWLRLLWVDGGYHGEAFAQWVKSVRAKLKVQVVKRSNSEKISLYCDYQPKNQHCHRVIDRSHHHGRRGPASTAGTERCGSAISGCDRREYGRQSGSRCAAGTDYHNGKQSDPSSASRFLRAACANPTGTWR